MLKWIFSPLSGLITPVGGNSQLNPFVSRYIEDEAANTVAEAYGNEFQVNTRIVFTNPSGCKIGHQAGETTLFSEAVDSNISIGHLAGYGPTSSSTGQNVAIGLQAKRSSNGFYNVAFGFTAGRFSSGNNNAMFGQGAASYMIGNHNVVFGSSAGYYAHGSYNIYLGYGSGASNTRRSVENYMLRIGTNTTLIGNNGEDDLIVGDMLNYKTQFKGDIEIKQKDVDTVSGLILTSPNNSKYRLTVNDDGSLSTELL